jgi:hypothetical protein
MSDKAKKSTGNKVSRLGEILMIIAGSGLLLSVYIDFMVARYRQNNPVIEHPSNVNVWSNAGYAQAGSALVPHTEEPKQIRLKEGDQGQWENILGRKMLVFTKDGKDEDVIYDLIDLNGKMRTEHKGRTWTDVARQRVRSTKGDITYTIEKW